MKRLGGCPREGFGGASKQPKCRRCGFFFILLSLFQCLALLQSDVDSGTPCLCAFVMAHLRSREREVVGVTKVFDAGPREDGAIWLQPPVTSHSCKGSLVMAGLSNRVSTAHKAESGRIVNIKWTTVGVLQ